MFGIRFWFKFLTGFWHLVQLGSLLSIKLILERSLASPYSKIQSSLYHTTLVFAGNLVFKLECLADLSDSRALYRSLRLRTFSHTAWIAVWDYTYLTRSEPSELGFMSFSIQKFISGIFIPNWSEIFIFVFGPVWSWISLFSVLLRTLSHFIKLLRL